MSGLPNHIIQHCQLLFPELDEFDDDRSLRFIFNDEELYPFRSYVDNNTKNTNERVRSVIDSLHNKHTTNGKSVFLIFLQKLLILSYQNKEDQRHIKLTELCKEVEKSSKEITELPFVIMAMNEKEAKNLISEAVFESTKVASEDLNFYVQFRNLLENNIADLNDYYGQNREDWRPYFNQSTTIEIIIEQTIEQMQELQILNSSRNIKPAFFSTDFFDEHKGKLVWDYLDSSGCVIIIDSLSFFHPFLRERLRSSELSGNDKTAIIIVSPVNHRRNRLNKLIEDEVSRRLERAFLRFDTKLDRLFEVGLGGECNLKRWLISILPKIEENISNPTMYPDNKADMEKIYKKTGIRKQVCGG